MSESTQVLRPLVIAVDGPSGSGKSSVSRAVAEKFGYRYLDTGAMYRAVALWMHQHGVDVSDPAAVAALVDDVDLKSGTDPSAPSISIDGEDVGEAIRTDAVTAMVSAVSAVPEVRAMLLERQRAQAAAAMQADTGIVVEGRDIGTTVLPDADLKIFLTADQEARAARRTAQDQQEGRGGEVSATAASLAARDAADKSRAASPLTKADDAVEVDATFMTFDEVVDRVTQLVVGEQ